jgi:hypothetical protein
MHKEIKYVLPGMMISFKLTCDLETLSVMDSRKIKINMKQFVNFLVHSFKIQVNLCKTNNSRHISS